MSLAVVRPSRSFRTTAALLALGAAGLGLFGSACSSEAPVTTAACDSAKCAAGNQCVTVGEETKCRKTCSSNLDATKACPFGFACTALAPQEAECTGAQCICTEQGPKLEKKDKGLWASPCNPADGIQGNKACDSAQQFTCYAQNPVDGEAYCTRACEKDADCGAGLFCGTVNDTPNAEVGTRQGNGTIRICQKRAYGSPCVSTVDCGGALVCVGDDKGQKFCTNKCATDNNCPVDAFCGERAGGSICYPNAGVILGDGSLCSPCKSDTDCKKGGGVCASNTYSTERFCTVPSASQCKSQDCPKVPEGVTGAGCATKAFDDIPAGHCLGTFKLAKVALPGCWTRERKK